MFHDELATQSRNLTPIFDVHLSSVRNLSTLILLFLMATAAVVGQTTPPDSIPKVDTTSHAVVVVDSVELRYGRDLCDTLPELADSIFKVLKTKKFDRMVPYIPTTDMLKEQFDSMDIKQLQKLAEIKHQYMVNNLRKQHLKMVKYAKVMHYSLRHMELVKMRIREKEYEEMGTRYGEITYLCKSGKRKFYVTFLAIEIVGKWFIGDELRIVDL